MNFWRYTFSGSFSYYAGIASVVATVVMLTCYVLGRPNLAWIIFFALTTLLKVGITGSYIRWRKYQVQRNRYEAKRILGIKNWGDKTRLN